MIVLSLGDLLWVVVMVILVIIWVVATIIANRGEK